MTSLFHRDEPTRSHAGRQGLWILVVLAVGFACFGITIRAWGISASGLFFDDAWFALPSRFPASKIFGMINTTPGYSLLQGVWIGLDPTSNAWAKSLALVFGIASIPAMALLGRRLGLRLLGCGGLMLLVVAAPVAIAYSVRVKQFEFDLFASIVVLDGRTAGVPPPSCLRGCSDHLNVDGDCGRRGWLSWLTTSSRSGVVGRL